MYETEPRRFRFVLNIVLLIQNFRCLFQKFNYIQMLWANTLALTTGNAISGSAASTHKSTVEVLRTPVIRITSESIDGSEYIWNANLHWTSRSTVFAGCTSDLWNTKNFHRDKHKQYQNISCLSAYIYRPFYKHARCQ